MEEAKILLPKLPLDLPESRKVKVLLPLCLWKISWFSTFDISLHCKLDPWSLCKLKMNATLLFFSVSFAEIFLHQITHFLALSFYIFTGATLNYLAIFCEENCLQIC